MSTSAPAERERIQRLEQAGVMCGCRPELDPASLDYPVAVMIRIRPMPGQLPKVIELAQKTPRGVECHRITGEDCLIVRAHLEGIDVLDGLLDSPPLRADDDIDHPVFARAGAKPSVARDLQSVG